MKAKRIKCQRCGKFMENPLTGLSSTGRIPSAIEPELARRFGIAENEFEICDKCATDPALPIWIEGLVNFRPKPPKRGVGRPALPPGEKRKIRTLKATDAEWKDIRDYARALKKRARAEK